MAVTCPRKNEVKSEMMPVFDMPPARDELLLGTYMERLLSRFPSDVAANCRNRIFARMFEVFDDGGPPYQDGFKVFRNKPA